jgi:hypothetical protein
VSRVDELEMEKRAADLIDFAFGTQREFKRMAKACSLWTIEANTQCLELNRIVCTEKLHTLV